MDVEWDNDKKESNYNKHRVAFEYAALIFEAETFSAVDRRQDYGEIRYRTIGVVDEQCFVVVHTERDGVIRIISARKGGRRDRKKYHAYLAGGTSRPEGSG